MPHLKTKIAILAALACAFAAPHAHAWGPTAQSAIVGTAFQVISKGYADPFKTVDINYERDVLAGAAAGRSVLNLGGHLDSDSDVMHAIGTEIQLLRDVRKRGSGGSYFAYRMGVLASMVSDVIFPLTFEHDAQGAQLRAQVERDIDKNLKSYQMRTKSPHLEYIRNPVQYLSDRQSMFADARTILAADYSRGEGYNGYAKSSGATMLQSTVEAVADVWFTVMRPEGDSSDVKPSTKSLTQYATEQVVYQLRDKKNMREAERAYRQFAALKSNSLAAYEIIGDAFYAFGPQGRDRAVQEWSNALALNGPERNRIMKKLAAHHLALGKAHLGEAPKPNAPRDALPNALENFTKALEYDQSSEEAAKLINETQIQISERDQRLALAIATLSAAESVVKQAEVSAVDQQYAEAIAQYKKATTVFEQVGDEFKEQFDAADTGKEDSKRQIARIITTVLDLASDRIEDGDRLLDEKKFDESIDQYQSVPTLLQMVPEDLTGPQAQEKLTLLDQSGQKVQDAEKAKVTQTEQDKARTAAGGVKPK
ncbi:MAG: hypothetical protein SGI88_03945 [Candidatus Hydrogenedentes bacterium]|nr:hypothetical protein [Candidatus Hydrogenedentota bacterium]